MLTKTHKNRLIQVCKVLFPRYKYVKVNKLKNSVTLTNCKYSLFSWLFPSWKMSLTELIEYQIPDQMADFKYGNKNFISVVQEDLLKCEMMKINKIDYFFDEVVKIKYADILKELRITPQSESYTDFLSQSEEEMYEDMIELFKEREQSKTREKYIFGIELNSTIIFYILLLSIVAFSVFYNIVT